jgi:hypothetical protein
MPMSVFVAHITILETHAAYAAEMQLPNGEFYFVGSIISGDSERFRTAIKQAGPNLQTINLRSAGGNVMEAIKIGRMVKELYLDTGAPLSPAFGPYAKHNCSSDHPMVRGRAPCLCGSACFFIWAAGLHPFGDLVFLHRISFERILWLSRSNAGDGEIRGRSKNCSKLFAGNRSARQVLHANAEHTIESFGENVASRLL